MSTDHDPFRAEGTQDPEKAPEGDGFELWQEREAQLREAAAIQAALNMQMQQGDHVHERNELQPTSNELLKAKWEAGSPGNVVSPAYDRGKKREAVPAGTGEQAKLNEPEEKSTDASKQSQDALDEPQQSGFTPLEEDPVKTGTTKEVLEWVGDDKERAQRALDAEKRDQNPRKGLVRGLEERLEK